MGLARLLIFCRDLAMGLNGTFLAVHPFPYFYVIMTSLSTKMSQKSDAVLVRTPDGGR